MSLAFDHLNGFLEVHRGHVADLLGQRDTFDDHVRVVLEGHRRLEEDAVLILGSKEIKLINS